MTYVSTWTGFAYLAIVLDVWSRRIVGWSVGEQMATEIVLSPLHMAIAQRRPSDVIHHSDQGSQLYASPDIYRLTALANRVLERMETVTVLRVVNA